jgi:hypothetical protein
VDAPLFYVISLLCSVRRTEVQVTARQVDRLVFFVILSFPPESDSSQGRALDYLSEEA